MTTRKDIAETAAFLAQRAPGFSYARIGSDALRLLRYGQSAVTNATNLCNVTNYQARYDRKKASMRSKVLDLVDAYQLTAEIGGDPRGSCLRLFAKPGTPDIRGNGWSGDEGGFCL